MPASSPSSPPPAREGAAREHRPIGEVLPALLAERGMSMRKLALATGTLSQSALSQGVRGRMRLSPERLEQIAEALEVRPEVFVEYRVQIAQRVVADDPELADEIFDRASGAKASG